MKSKNIAIENMNVKVEGKQYRCKTCSARVNNKHDLDFHMLSHGGYSCTKCNRKYKTFQTLWRHCTKTCKERSKNKEGIEIQERPVHSDFSSYRENIRPSTHMSVCHKKSLPIDTNYRFESQTKLYCCKNCQLLFNKLNGYLDHKCTSKKENVLHYDMVKTLPTNNLFLITKENKAFKHPSDNYLCRESATMLRDEQLTFIQPCKKIECYLGNNETNKQMTVLFKCKKCKLKFRLREAYEVHNCPISAGPHNDHIMTTQFTKNLYFITHSGKLHKYPSLNHKCKHVDSLKTSPINLVSLQECKNTSCAHAPMKMTSTDKSKD